MSRVCICRRGLTEADRPPVCEPELFAAYNGGTAHLPENAAPPVVMVRERYIALEAERQAPRLSPLTKLAVQERRLQVSGR